jgi:hypothetical protein
MRTQRGKMDTTLNKYRLPIIDLLDDLGTEPSAFDAIGLWEFLLRRVLRYSAATRMLREGVSLPAIGALLRHASIETTTVYAKVDVDLLQEVAMPWPEVQPCWQTA